MKKDKKTLVWQITPPDTEGVKPSYIIGTMHVRDARAFQFENQFYEAIHACEAFATEFNLDDLQNATGFALSLPDGLMLSNLIKPKTFAKISRVVSQKMGMPLTHFNVMKPIMVTNLLTESVMSNDRMMSLDETLWRFASENGKILRGIETLDEQIEILNKMSLGEQIKGLKDLTANFSKFRRQLLDMAKLYEQADIQKLYKAARRSTKGNRRLLLFDRNEKMAQRIADLTQQTTLCAAIGAGHLAGKKGVLRLLKNNGFEVKPI
jgi:uncharacterized protein